VFDGFDLVCAQRRLPGVGEVLSFQEATPQNIAGSFNAKGLSSSKCFFLLFRDDVRGHYISLSAILGWRPTPSLNKNQQD
jgi:hypothetical protein